MKHTQNWQICSNWPEFITQENSSSWKAENVISTRKRNVMICYECWQIGGTDLLFWLSESSKSVNGELYARAAPLDQTHTKNQHHQINDVKNTKHRTVSSNIEQSINLLKADKLKTVWAFNVEEKRHKENIVLNYTRLGRIWFGRWPNREKKLVPRCRERGLHTRGRRKPEFWTNCIFLHLTKILTLFFSLKIWKWWLWWWPALRQCHFLKVHQLPLKKNLIGQDGQCVSREHKHLNRIIS